MTHQTTTRAATRLACGLIFAVASAAAAAQPNPWSTVKTVGEMDWLNLPAELPHGSRIDYFTVQFYDTSSRSSVAFLQTMSIGGSSGLQVWLTSSGEEGYQSLTSDYLGNVVDTETFAYVFSWLSRQPDDSLQLCGVRVEYRVPVAGGGWSEARYLSAPGSTFLPQDSGTGVRYEGGGCISAFPVLVFSDGFESGDSDGWSTGAK